MSLGHAIVAAERDLTIHERLADILLEMEKQAIEREEAIKRDLNERMDKFELRMDKFELRMDKLDQKIEDLRTLLRTTTFVIYGHIFASYALIIVAVLTR